MLSAYVPLFRVPGALRFIAGTALSRVGGSMFGVAIIVMLSERRGSFGLAGAISAVGVGTLAVAGPFIGRLIDKHGQRRIAMSRARWAHIYRDDADQLHTAMSFEQVADEGSFVIGPVVAVLVSTLWFPEAGLLIAELLFTVGMVAFLTATATEPPVVAHENRPAGLAIRWPGLMLVATALTMTGVIFGSNEVIAVAFADARGNTGFSSVVLGGFALGSTLAGIVFGSRKFNSTLSRRLLLAAAGMFVLEAPAFFMSGRSLWSCLSRGRRPPRCSSRACPWPRCSCPRRW